ncbi:hypothetical protein TRIUR3_24091 [Triticum urartu]|uniref:Uncharacterized protein n=1 Tax=Triticum urartu TaxID=4572 RepID=M7YRE9_TRIUA|nr:hypothetical protein TRIUR3_24091 [Triticum urartu]
MVAASRPCLGCWAWPCPCRGCAPWCRVLVRRRWRKRRQRKMTTRKKQQATDAANALSSVVVLQHGATASPGSNDAMYEDMVEEMALGNEATASYIYVDRSFWF